MPNQKIDKSENIGMSDEEFDRQFEEATRRGAQTRANLPQAVAAGYDQKTKSLRLEMTSGVIVFVPVRLIQGLQSEDDAALADLQLTGDGTQIHWDALDVQFRVQSLISGIFGTPGWMSDLREHLAANGAKGGAARTEAKSAASRENGKKGGRPRKNVPAENR